MKNKIFTKRRTKKQTTEDRQISLLLSLIKPKMKKKSWYVRANRMSDNFYVYCNLSVAVNVAQLMSDMIEVLLT